MEKKPILDQQGQQQHQQPDVTSSSKTEENGGGKSKIDNLIAKTLQKRYILAFYSFSGFLLAYSLRANLSVAIVDMSKVDRVTYEDVDPITNQTIIKFKGDWSPILQGYILSSFFYGYIVTQLPAAFYTTKYGGRVFFGAGVGICSVLALLTPLAAHMGITFIIILRILQGLAQGFMFPSMHCLWSKWAPPNERSRLATFAFSGTHLGSVVALSFGGIIGERISWHFIFYIFGLLGIVWTIFWFMYISENPSSHKTISNDEKLLIESSLTYHEANAPIPWRTILRSLPVWAIVFAHFAENWGMYTMLTELPTFLSDTMNYKIEKAGLISALPYLIMAKVLYTSGFISDWLINKNWSFTTVRKLFCCVGLVAQFVFMILTALSTSSASIVICSTMAIGLGGMPWSAFGVNHLDIGAGYANVLMSISNTFATLPGIISPILTGHLIQEKTKSEWNIVFVLSGLIYLVGAIVFGFISKGETQPWAVRMSDLEATAGATPSPPSQKTGVDNISYGGHEEKQQQQASS